MECFISASSVGSAASRRPTCYGSTNFLSPVQAEQLDLLPPAVSAAGQHIQQEVGPLPSAARWSLCDPAALGALVIVPLLRTAKRKRLLQQRFRRLVLAAQPFQAKVQTTQVVEEEDCTVELHGASVRRGPDEILEDVELEIPRGARAIIVGPNGSGKTTLLTVIAGLEQISMGRLEVNATSIGWLRQEAVSGSTKTVYAEAISEMEAQRLGHILEEKQAALEATSSESEVASAQSAYDEALAAFEGAGGFDIEQRATQVLTGLSFKPQDFKRPCSSLSGGWQMRVALARALLSDPELLLLDEPTNHMDASAKRWLASYLENGLSPGSTLLLVTHDRALLEDIQCTNVIEISDRRVFRYDCKGIRQWENLRASKVGVLQKEVAKLERSIAADTDYIKRFGAKASHAAQGQSRKKKVAKMEVELASLKEALRGLPTKVNKSSDDEVTFGTLPLASPSKMRLKLPDAPLNKHWPIDQVLLGLRNAKVGHEDGTIILDNLQCSIGPASRIALLGPNGCGKTTLLKTLAGTLPVMTGMRTVGSADLRRARVALFTQDLAQDLPSDQTPIDYVLGDGAPIMLDTEGARKALGALGLRSEVHNSPISTLSGGEKARVALAVFATRPADVLLLDEPTNHLDGAAVKALCAGLRAHQGAVVVASHDQAFVDELSVTRTFTILKGSAGKPSEVEMRQGPPGAKGGPSSFTGDAKDGATAAAATAGVTAPADAEPAPKRVLSRQEWQKERRKNQARENQSKSLLKKIEEQEAAVEKAQQEMNEEYSEDAYAKYMEAQAKLDDMYERWEALEEEIAA